jgi:hypothetical protein
VLNTNRFDFKSAGSDVRDEWDTVAAVCLVTVLGLPCAVIELALDSDFLGILSKAILAVFACTLTVVTWSGFSKFAAGRKQDVGPNAGP